MAGSSIMIVAGEQSGENYGALLARELQEGDPGVRLFGIGGDLMRDAGVNLLFHVRELAFMGFAEVIRHLPFIRKVMKRCVDALDQFKPDTVVLIDYPGFNLRFARRAKERGIRVIYYISPQVWAWGSSRVEKMKGLIDHMIVVFPFEEELYAQAGIPATFVGHPIVETLATGSSRADFLRTHELEDRPLLALLPGSRRQEILRHLPVFAKAAIELKQKHGCAVAVAKASAVPRDCYDGILKTSAGISIVENDTHRLLEHAHAAIVASGTATVETAFYLTPMVVAYRTNPLTYLIGKQLINVRHIGMINILAGKQVAPEIIQYQLTADNLIRVVDPYLLDEQLYRNAIDNLRKVKSLLGKRGASAKAAGIILRTGKNETSPSLEKTPG